MTWSEAIEYVESLNKEKNTAGVAEVWRLPSLEELKKLHKELKEPPAVKGYYWSSTIPTHEPDYVWVLNLDGGHAGLGLKTSSYQVYCVRND